MADPTSPFAQALDWLVQQVPQGTEAPRPDPTGVGYVNVDMGPQDFAKALAEALNWFTPSGGEESIAGLPGGFGRRRLGEALDPEIITAWRARHPAFFTPETRGKHKYMATTGGEPSWAGGKTPQDAIREIEEFLVNTRQEFNPRSTFATNPNLKNPKILPKMMSVEQKKRIQSYIDILGPDNFGSLLNAFRSQAGPELEVWGEVLTRPSARGYAPYRTPSKRPSSRQPNPMLPDVGPIPESSMTYQDAMDKFDVVVQNLKNLFE